MEKQCGCSCQGHSCYCLKGKCKDCGCGPGYYQIKEARSDHCPIHSMNIPYGQPCPACTQGNG